MPNEQKQEQVKEVTEKKVISDNKKGLLDTVSATISEKLKKPEVTQKEGKPEPEQTKGLTEGEQSEKLFKVEDLTSDLTPKKVIKMVLVFILLILIVLAVYVKFIRKTPVRETVVLLNPPTPTSYAYQRYKPSIYAEDKNFKKIDEGISVLENEVKSIQIEEKTLLPPTLDFDITF